MSDQETSDYWWDQRYEAEYFDIHGHFVGQESVDCSLCKEL